MIWISAALLSLLSLHPQDPQNPVPGGGRDVVILKSGERLEGSIVIETEDYIEIRLGERTVVGFGKAQTKSIQRGVAAEVPQFDLASVPGLQERDLWFLLHNGEGFPVGWLHSTVTVDENRNTRFGEKWQFTEDRRTTTIAILEILDENRNPVSCYYHEWSTNAGDERIYDENIVEGKVVDGKLVVQRLSAAGRTETSYGMPAGTRFPLELAEEFRQAPGASTDGDVYNLYDPRVDEFVVRRLGAGRWREVEIDGEVKRVRELIAETSSGLNSEWFGPSAIVLRREINGPALVAIPSTEARARYQATSDQQVTPSALRSEPGKRFALWLPNPAWEFDEAPLDGEVTARSDIHDARASLILLDYMDPELLLESVADAVLKWHKLMGSDFELQLRSPVVVRQRQAVRLVGVSKQRQVSYRTVIYVMPCSGTFAAFTTVAPEASFSQLEGDFERFLDTLELDRQGVEPQAPALLQIRR